MHRSKRFLRQLESQVVEWAQQRPVHSIKTLDIQAIAALMALNHHMMFHSIKEIQLINWASSPAAQWTMTICWGTHSKKALILITSHRAACRLTSNSLLLSIKRSQCKVLFPATPTSKSIHLNQWIIASPMPLGKREFLMPVKVCLKHPSKQGAELWVLRIRTTMFRRLRDVLAFQQGKRSSQMTWDRLLEVAMGIESSRKAVSIGLYS